MLDNNDAVSENYSPSASAEQVTEDKPVVNRYNTWGPKNLSADPTKIPLWPIVAGLGCFIGFQVAFGVLYLIVSAIQGAGWVENLIGFDPNSGQISPDTSSVEYPFGFILGSLIIGWVGLLVGVWFAGRRTTGGWKKVVLWKFDWKKDILIAVVFTIVFRLLETTVGVLLDKVWHVDVSKLGNTGILSDFTGWKQVCILFGAAVCAPIVEELFFRGVFLRAWVEKLKLPGTETYAVAGSVTVFIIVCLYTFISSFPLPVTVALIVAAATLLTWNLRKRKTGWAHSGAVISILLSSFTFGLLHAQTTPAATAYTVASTAIIGAMLGIMYLKTRRLGTTVLAHVALNSSAVLMLLLFGVS